MAQADGEYISKNALRNEIGFLQKYNVKTHETTMDAVLYDDVVMCIKDMPSVAIPNKTGHWIWQTEDIYQCSECGEDIHVKEVMNEPQYICCPMCACPMEVENG